MAAVFLVGGEDQTERPHRRSATRANAAPARTMAAQAPFMSVEPRPKRRSPSIVGAKGSVRQSHGRVPNWLGVEMTANRQVRPRTSAVDADD